MTEPDENSLNRVLKLHAELIIDGHSTRDISSSFLSVVLMDLISNGVSVEDAIAYLESSTRDCYVALTKEDH